MIPVKKKSVSFLITIVLVFTTIFPMSAFAEGNLGNVAQIFAGDLKTEYAENPLGLDVLRPRLSWVLESDKRAQKQTAYQVLVSTTEEKLAADNGDMWDSGKVISDQTVQVEYNGLILQSCKRYYWKVRVWDKDGNPSVWSHTAWWETGLLKSEDWNAKWIDPSSNIGLQWTDYTLEMDFTVKYSLAGIFFRAKDLGNNYMWQIKSGNPGVLKAHVCKNGAYSVLKEVPIGREIKRDTEYRLKIEIKGNEIKTYIDGELVDTTIDNTFSSGKMGFRSDGPERALFDNVKVYNGSSVLFADDFSNDSANNFPGTAIVNGKLDISGSTGGSVLLSQSNNILRKQFMINKEIKKARVYVSGLGYSELFMNGQKVGDNVLDPGFTDYDKEVSYLTYDVTSYLKQNENVIGVMLGNGWYYCLGKGTPKMILQMDIEFADGTKMKVLSDDTWKATRGPVTSNSIYGGEVYDARLEQAGWNNTGYDDSSWGSANLTQGPSGMLVSQSSPSDKVMGTITPVKVTNPEQGTYIYDFGQNFTGWVKLKVEGPKGTKIKLKFYEELNESYNYGQEDTYFLKGEGMESYEPRFTWHGFRYVKVTGFPGTPGLDNLEGKVVHSSVETVGSFDSSNQLINQIQNITSWSILSNLHGGIPSDCPHRERKGYTGDGQIVAESAIQNFDMATFYIKWINDIKEAQNPQTGFVPNSAPDTGGGGGPAWGSAITIVPWEMYTYYGDKRILEDNYEGMKKWVAFLKANTENNILMPYGGFWDFLGDWCPPDRGQDNTANWPSMEIRSLTNTFYYYKNVKIVSDVARILGRDDDVSLYTALAEDIKTSFNNKYFDAVNNQYGDGSQACNVFALIGGMVPEDKKDAVLNNIVNDVEVNHSGHLDTGIMGTKYLLDVLTEGGRGDVAYNIVTQTTYPSWGYMINNGATTLWEQWNGVFSHNHPMFGSVSAWFYKYLAGIKPLSPGYKNISIKPYIPDGLQHASASIQTMRGSVSSSWKIEDNSFKLDVTIPVNTTAKVYVPSVNPSEVTEGGISAVQAEGVEFLGSEDGCAVFSVGSGSYSFVGYPDLVTIEPANGMMDVSTAVNPRVSFCRPVDPASISDTTVKLVRVKDNIIIPVTFTLDNAGTNLILQPVEVLQDNTQYKVIINGVKYAQGQSVAKVESSFTTRMLFKGLKPDNGTANVPLNYTPNVEFTLPIDTSSVNIATAKLIRLNDNSTVVLDYQFENSNRTLTMLPKEQLLNNSRYVVIIDGIKDQSGIQLPKVKSTFTTPNTSENLALNKPVTARTSIEAGEWGKARLTDGLRTSTVDARGYTSQPKSSAIGNEWISIDLGEKKELNIVTLYPRTTVYGHEVAGDNNDVDGCHFPHEFEIQISSDGTSWETVKRVTEQGRPFNTPRSYIFQPNQGRYVRIYVTEFGQPGPLDALAGVHYLQLAEVEVYNSPDIKVAPSAINLKPAVVNLAVGTTQSVTARIYDEDNKEITSKLPVEWVSDNTNIASVADGLIIGITVGTTTIRAMYGGIEKEIVVTVEVDDTPPATAAQVTGSEKNGWYSTDVTVELNAVDDLSGVEKTEYSLDEGNTWINYTKPILLTSEGEYALKYRSIDKMGNIEGIQALAIAIDKSAPTYTLMANGKPLANNAVLQDAQKLILELMAVDELSGINSEAIFVDNQAYITGTEIDFAGKLGVHTVKVVLTDKAGNYIEPVITINVTTSISSMKQLIARYEVSNDLYGSLLSQLSNNLDQAQQQLDINRPDQAAKHMEDFIKHLNNDAQKSHVSEEAKALLNIDAEALIHLFLNDKSLVEGAL